MRAETFSSSNPGTSQPNRRDGQGDAVGRFAGLEPILQGEIEVGERESIGEGPRADFGGVLFEQIFRPHVQQPGLIDLDGLPPRLESPTVEDMRGEDAIVELVAGGEVAEQPGPAAFGLDRLQLFGELAVRLAELAAGLPFLFDQPMLDEHLA
jgi:hypothetical protein